LSSYVLFFFFFQAEDGIRDVAVTGVQTCALPIYAAAVHQAHDELELVQALEVGKLGVVARRHQGLEARRDERRDAAAQHHLLPRSEEHTSELQSRLHLVCRLLLEKKKKSEEHCRL